MCPVQVMQRWLWSIYTRYINDFYLIMKIRDKSSKTVLGFLRNCYLKCEVQAVPKRDVLWQSLQHRPLSASSKVTGGQMHLFKTKLLNSWAVALSLSFSNPPAPSPDAMEGLLKWAMLLRTLCVNLGRLSQTYHFQPEQKQFQPQPQPWPWAQTQRPPSAFLLQRLSSISPQKTHCWAQYLTGN